MKYLLILIISCYSVNLIAQNNMYYDVLYRVESMTLNTYKKPNVDYASLYTNATASIFQWENERVLDSIKNTRAIDNDDLNRYFSKEKYAIEINKNTLTYYDSFGDEEYQYKEQIQYNWAIKADTKTINGYVCKKAVLNYGGRQWIAWYALELPLNSGPYKFKGLPGLIFKITDSTNSYNFELVKIKNRTILPLQKQHHLKPTKDRVYTNRTTFNKTKFKYKSLGFKERMDLLNKKQGTNNIMEFSSDSGSNPFNNSRQINHAKANNFIEIDHKK